jgi:hypothetical protein
MSDGQDDERPYEVGYGKPPVEHRFKPGKSGNPRGRDKGLKNLRTILEQEGAARVKVVEGGRSRSMSKLEATVKRLHARALNGDMRAIERVLDLNIRLLGLDVAPEVDPSTLCADDEAILQMILADKALAGGDDDAA